MRRVLREITLLILVPLTSAMMCITTRLIEEDRRARAVREHWS